METAIHFRLGIQVRLRVPQLVALTADDVSTEPPVHHLWRYPRHLGGAGHQHLPIFAAHNAILIVMPLAKELVALGKGGKID